MIKHSPSVIFYFLDLLYPCIKKIIIITIIIIIIIIIMIITIIIIIIIKFKNNNNYVPTALYGAETWSLPVAEKI